MKSKKVIVCNQGVRFGNCFFSHESITGYSAEQLNSGDCRITGSEYMKWFNDEDNEDNEDNETKINEEA